MHSDSDAATGRAVVEGIAALVEAEARLAGNAMPVLLQVLWDHNPAVRKGAVQGIFRNALASGMAEAYMPALTQALTDQHWGLCECVAEGLVKLVQASTDQARYIMPFLLEALKCTNAVVRQDIV